MLPAHLRYVTSFTGPLGVAALSPSVVEARPLDTDPEGEDSLM